ncbi:outer membrane beta-barrel protein [Hyphomonas sp.]|uniref:outer membrane beta-barrel protein n=1 Tax=Hyphomonas sp. TaxID=87 RepID=UPI003242EF2B
MIRRAIVLGLVAASVTQGAMADEPFDGERGFYVAVRGYGSIADQNNIVFEDTREIAGAVGYRISDSVRVEGEYGFRWSNVAGLNGAREAHGNFTSRSMGAHVFYDFRKGKKLRPFVGAGGGAGVQDFEFSGPADINPDFIVEVKDTNSSAYWNALAGTSYHFSPRFRLSAGVEYVTYTDQAVASNIGGIDGINRAYNFYVGARWFLGRTHK